MVYGLKVNCIELAKHFVRPQSIIKNTYPPRDRKKVSLYLNFNLDLPMNLRGGGRGISLAPSSPVPQPLYPDPPANMLDHLARRNCTDYLEVPVAHHKGEKGEEAHRQAKQP